MAWVTEIKVRAERKAGELLAKMPRKNGEKGGEGIRSTLEQIDVPVTTAHRWQKLAAISDDKFEQAVAAAKEVAGEVTTAAMLRHRGVFAGRAFASKAEMLKVPKPEPKIISPGKRRPRAR